MADEIRINASMQVSNAAYRHSFRPGQLTVDQSGQGRSGYVQIIQTSAQTAGVGTAIDFGSDSGTPGWLTLQNLDKNNFISWGPNVTTLRTMGKLLPGEFAVFRMHASASLIAMADTAQCRLDVRLFED